MSTLNPMQRLLPIVYTNNLRVKAKGTTRKTCTGPEGSKVVRLRTEGLQNPGSQSEKVR
jgi:hypothetical protein